MLCDRPEIVELSILHDDGDFGTRSFELCVLHLCMFLSLLLVNARAQFPRPLIRPQVRWSVVRAKDYRRAAMPVRRP